jgi:hypothetical protein
MFALVLASSPEMLLSVTLCKGEGKAEKAIHENIVNQKTARYQNSFYT